MPRLPEPGGDTGQWGQILNDYLSAVHKPDGTLKENSVTADTIAPNAITEDNLSQSIKNQLETIAGQQGSTGATGPQGTPGATGATGLAGASGTPGPQGATGASGPQGVPGADGQDGGVGATGAPGQIGATGAQGPDGPTGPAGEDGAQGATGATGAPGATTIAGIDGLQGVLDNKLETSRLDTDGTLAAESDTTIASQKAVKTYVDAQVVGSNVHVYQNYADAPPLPVDTIVISRTGS